MTLLTDFRDEARRRGVLAADEAVTLGSAFRVVRDMPYARATDRAEATVIREWRGTCSGKHYLLAAILDALGYEAAVLLATHSFTADNAPWLPPALLDEVRRGPVPDVHTFLRVRSDPVADEWMTIDATWPLSAGALGLPVNARLTPGIDQRIACEIEEIIHVPDDEDPQAMKERILELHAGDEAARRDLFIEALASWLAASTGAGR